MRISDWSSDVCSSDLITQYIALQPEQPVVHPFPTGRLQGQCLWDRSFRSSHRWRSGLAPRQLALWLCRKHHQSNGSLRQVQHGLSRAQLCGRSEEHTSELQSLLRISYAVFGLKKKTQTK